MNKDVYIYVSEQSESSGKNIYDVADPPSEHATRHGLI